MDSDEDILRQVAGGDTNAFRYLFDAHRDKLYAYMYRISGSAESAKDIVQDVFLKIWMDRSSLPAIRNFDAYLFTLARNHAFNQAKKLVYRNDILRELTIGKDELSYETEHSLRYKALQSRFEKALSRLPERQRHIFTMHRMEGIPVDEISRLLNISEGTVKKHLSLATLALKEVISHHLEIILILYLATPVCL